MQRNDGKGDYPFTDDCDRFENGGQSTNVPPKPGEARADPKTATMYSSQWGCREQFTSGLLHFVSRIRDRRYVAVDEEQALTLEDTLGRRLPLLLKSRDQGLAASTKVAQRMGEKLGWSASRVEAEIALYRGVVERSRKFRT